eukprot:12907465-Prorocentrum_lima.AAC.1
MPRSAMSDVALNGLLPVVDGPRPPFVVSVNGAPVRGLIRASSAGSIRRPDRLSPLDMLPRHAIQTLGSSKERRSDPRHRS